MRRLLWFSVGFAAACLAGAVFYGAWLIFGAAITLLAAGILTAVHKKYGHCMLPILILLGMATGLCWFGAYDSLFVTVPRAADGQSLNVSIEATEYSYQTDYGSAVEGNVEINGKTYRVKAYLRSKEQVSPGDSVNGTFRFRLTTAGGMEKPTTHRTEGIFLLAYPIGTAELHHADEISWRHYPAQWRYQLLERMKEIMPGDAGAFASALLLGERSGITYEMDTAFRLSGISHIIAVSGLHVSILFGLIHTILAKRRWLSCLIGIPVLILFAAIAGFTPSITRACIMQSLMLIAMCLDREYDPPTALAFAVLVMLVANPLTILSVSFQLSVSCMIGIFLFSERIRTYLLERMQGHVDKKNKLFNRLIHGIASSVGVSMSASLITTPLVAYYFGCISVVSVLTNLLTVWIINFIFYGLILCLLVSTVSMVIAKVLASAVMLPIYFVLYTAGILAKLPLAAVYTSSIYTVVWLIGAYVLVAIFLLLRKKQPQLILLGVLFSFLLAQLFAWIEPLHDDFRITVLDVGQGQSVLLQSEGKAFLVDCGGDDGEDAADITAETLLSQGICRLDGIVVTHFDKDHVGGVEHLLSRIRTDRLIVPAVQDAVQIAEGWTFDTDIIVEYVSSDLLYTFGKAEMTIFAPISRESDNESGICILFQRENCGILITGDRGILGETILLHSADIPELDVLIVGHHGSSGSTGEALLEATRPKQAVISVGANNPYRHPSKATLKRLETYGCIVRRTDLEGTIIIRG